ncbi:MAG: AMP-binding protein [Gordonia sp. (in: high G+C Gram-positive bacteria)]|uniref:class I adenylate-forming enzyme family protein n=1 Tax=Gordonia TaxID=2053 RepID=UPI00326648D0
MKQRTPRGASVGPDCDRETAPETIERLEARFERLVAAGPDRLALVDEKGVRLTRADLWARSGELLDKLVAEGLRRGDVITICMPNTAEWQVAFLAALRLEAIPASIPMSSDRAALAHAFDLVQARAIIAPEAHRRHRVGEWVRELAEGSSRIASTVIYAADGQPTLQTYPGDDLPPAVPPIVDHLMFTSSTTGMPKAVMHTTGTLAAANDSVIERFGISEDTPIFMPSPLGHSVGAWHGGRLSLYSGAPLILQDQWDPVRALEIVDEQQCAFTAIATPFLKDLVDAPWPADRVKLSSMTTCLCGGAPVPPSLLEAATRQAPSTFVTVLWGMTEGTGTTCTPQSTQAQLVETAGTPLSDIELSIADPDDSGAGELLMRGPGVFIGYFGQDDLYRELITDDGWFRTGDLARIDADDYLHLTGRLKDMIIRGGVNISPKPIEDLIAAHPAVRRVAVIGESDDRLGERICAVIVTAGEAPSKDELNAWLREQGLSERKLPESLVVVDEMPVTAVGKIRKAVLRRILEESA